MNKPFSLAIIILFLLLANIAFAQKYQIIVHSFQSESIANAEVNKLRASGFVNAGSTYNEENNSYRVYINNYNSRDAANNDLNTYKSKFPGSWILGTENQQQSRELKRTKNELAELKTELGTNSENIGEILNEIESIQNEINYVKGNMEQDSYTTGLIEKLEERMILLNQYIVNLEENFKENEKEIASLNQNIEELSKNYVSKTDTVNYSFETIEGRFEFGRPRVSFDVGLLHTQFFSDLSTNNLAYFDLDETDYTNNIYGMNMALAFFLSEKWKLGISTQAYFYNSSYYLFPTFDIIYSKQIGLLPIKLSPRIGVGSELYLPASANLKAGEFLKASAGIDAELGISRYFSVFAAGIYNYTIPVGNRSSMLNDFQHYNVSFGIRFNI
jgi:peptidoglycan hydrolase CwlO-like protein